MSTCILGLRGFSSSWLILGCTYTWYINKHTKHTNTNIYTSMHTNILMHTYTCMHIYYRSLKVIGHHNPIGVSLLGGMALLEEIFHCRVRLSGSYVSKSCPVKQTTSCCLQDVQLSATSQPTVCQHDALLPAMTKPMNCKQVTSFHYFLYKGCHGPGVFS